MSPPGLRLSCSPAGRKRGHETHCPCSPPLLPPSLPCHLPHRPLSCLSKVTLESCCLSGPFRPPRSLVSQLLPCFWPPTCGLHLPLWPLLPGSADPSSPSRQASGVILGPQLFSALRHLPTQGLEGPLSPDNSAPTLFPSVSFFLSSRPVSTAYSNFLLLSVICLNYTGNAGMRAWGTQLYPGDKAGVVPSSCPTWLGVEASRPRSSCGHAHGVCAK